MDNDDAMIGTIWSRRQALRLGFGALVGGALIKTFATPDSATAEPSARIPTATTSPAPLVVSPALTEGPFFVDERLNRSNLIGKTKRKSVVEGTPLQMNLTVLKLDRAGITTPLTGAQVDVWHSDAVGIYSDESDPMNPEITSGQRWLRGYQLVDANGSATFSTIVPGWYEGRTPHIHFKVRQFSAEKKQTADFTSQFFFPDPLLDQIYKGKPYNSRGARNMLKTDDGIFSERLKDGTMAGSHQTLSLTPANGGYVTNFTILVSDASLHDRPHGGPGGPGGPPPDDRYIPPQFWGM